MSEQVYLIAKAERDLTSERYKKKRNKNLAIAGGSAVGGTALGIAARAGLRRGVLSTPGLAALGVGRMAALGGAIGGTGAAVYRHGQYVGSARRAGHPVAG